MFCSSVTLKKKPCLFNYTISGCILNRVSTQKDLGIFIDSKLNFFSHVTHVVKKVNRMIGLVWRNFRCCKNECVLRTLYCSLIRPRLEYCTLVFNSISQSQSDRLERLKGVTCFLCTKFFTTTIKVISRGENLMIACSSTNISTASII